MTNPTPLYPDTYYHIYNRGVNGENLFYEDRNYRFFLNKYAKYIEPIAQTYAYCLLRNHFHLFVRIRDPDEDLTGFQNLSGLPPPKPLNPSRQFGNLFNSYAKTINNTYGRYGSLFCRPFKRIPVTSPSYFITLVNYIHRNPQHHGFVTDFRHWPHSSYHTILATGPTRLQRDTVIGWYGSRHAFIDAHIYEGEDLDDELRLENENDPT